MTHPLGRFALALAAVGLVVAAVDPGVARANGRFPVAGQIAVDPSKPSHIVVRTTYGIVTTQDAKSWSWICDGAVGFGGFEDPMMAITKDGSVLAGIFEGLSVTHDGGCDWSFASGGLASRYVIDLATDRANPSSAVLLVSNSSGMDQFLTQMWQTADDGKTWAEIGSDVPIAVLGLTCDTSPSDPNRLYVTGRIGAPNYGGVLERSEDRGKTWTQLAIPGTDDTNLPYIGAVDPKDPDTVYVRVNSAMTDWVLLTKDGGKTWSNVFQAKGNLLGFALSPDGGTVAVGGITDGLWTAPTGSMTFTKVSKVEVKCLTWTDAGLYACTDEFVDGFTAGLSVDQGKTFHAVMHLTSPCGQLACDATSTTGKACVGLWQATETLLGGQCGHEDGQGGGGGGSAGAGGAAAASSASGGSKSGTSTGGVDTTAGGCACEAGPGAGSGVASSLAAVGAAFALSRGRSRRRRRDGARNGEARRS